MEIKQKDYVKSNISKTKNKQEKKAQEKIYLAEKKIALKKNKDMSNLNKTPIESFLELKLGDLVVHENHGIGFYKGIERITISGCTKDYLKLEYADSGILFVQTAQINLVQKYIGSQEVKINKLGGTEWQKTKTRAREDIKKIAFDLVDLYKKRKESKGFKFSEDNQAQKKFEAEFQYEETPDQLAAIKDIKRDMQSDLVMDRLICGDVGYGKTEVAMRAAFKAVQDKKQVIYLVPTTILAQQHYNTFLNRFNKFKINIQVISRFKTESQQKKIIKDLKSGKIDIIIGTHKLLSNEISFKDPGLIIIDEEQRFGVTHKEKLKKLKENIDVLTLSATPIPRTLNMSLSGMRDMSLLTEPPHERQPIKTFVLEHNEEIIKQAIERELKRGGQVYYLYNMIEDIDRAAFKIKQLVPNAIIRYAHGKLSELELEHIMSEFIDGKIDILVCTTIIETGMDIPNVNTIIINNADKIGLAQLYQLRGRVGRSSKLGYAYLTYEKHKVLSETAKKRLETIREFIEFGAGFKIALKDLEIRGAGNLLGAEQHGNIDNIGYDLYCKLLQEEISQLENISCLNQTTVDINISSYIPEIYIRNENERLEIYKKISCIKDQESYLKISQDLEKKFGRRPDCVKNLLNIALLKSMATKLGINSITQKQNNLIITLDSNANIALDKLIAIIQREKNLFFTAGINPVMTFKFSASNDIIYLTNLFEEML